MGYPTEYGIIENTLADDGDPLDILVLSSILYIKYIIYNIHTHTHTHIHTHVHTRVYRA